ncbi:GNAT family N-acetyltransferase [Salibacterium halotolerans]|uniref:Riboflavin biosynthesis RibT protein n=1 Tax=Salibacterium halotolerans TaxID=1884432 RepID=A0A1I5NUV8_9BACI|nr:GNAT family N-acetyltransferase [Salibacterium halotolerans]SFP25553.1 riboflavin biosynthesis RibT protein [Salibacterium halotolerans]
MFIKFKSAYKKIAMGLLSYMPEEKEVKKLQETMQYYENEENWQLYLWKEQEDIVGVMGLYFHEDGSAELKHICVNPSYREEGIGKKMVLTMKDRLEGSLTGCEETEDFLDTCEEKDSRDDKGKTGEASG